MPSVSHILIALGVTALAVIALILFFPAYGDIKEIAPPELPAIVVTPVTATSSIPTVVATTTATTTPAIPSPGKTPPKQIPPAQSSPAPVTPKPTSPPPASTPPPVISLGTTTLVVQNVPLLSGGTAHAGDSVPVAYLQVNNIGKEGALLQGFWVRQNGSAPVEAIIGLSTVDDMGGSRGLVGGIEGATPFKNGFAFASTTAYFAPGQMRLFTIKVITTSLIAPYVGTQLMIDVPSIQSTAAAQGNFPIPGTIWTLAL